MRHKTTTALFQHSLQTTDRWLKEIMTDLRWLDHHKAYTALRATLHALREQLPVNECAQLSAQLPLVLRGVFWEGWNPSCAKPHQDAFLSEIHAAFKHDSDTDPERVARAVFKTLTREVSVGEMEDVRSILPRDIRKLIPATKTPSEPLARHEEPVRLEAGDVGAVHWGA
jgi:uncharacterized protein (DUF2267 family)